jgi:hypothetical protein
LAEVTAYMYPSLHPTYTVPSRDITGDADIVELQTLRDQDTTPFATLETPEDSMPKTLCEEWYWFRPAIGQTAPPWSADVADVGLAVLSHNNTSATRSIIWCLALRKTVIRVFPAVSLSPQSRAD